MLIGFYFVFHCLLFVGKYQAWQILSKRIWRHLILRQILLREFDQKGTLGLGSRLWVKNSFGAHRSGKWMAIDLITRDSSLECILHFVWFLKFPNYMLQLIWLDTLIYCLPPSALKQRNLWQILNMIAWNVSATKCADKIGSIEKFPIW